jgi:hypothetical protein
MDQEQVRRAQWQIGREYLDMPGLSLSEPQARKLLGLPRDLCEAALRGLARHGFLVETASGTFIRRSLEPTAFSVVRPAVRFVPWTTRPPTGDEWGDHAASLVGGDIAGDGDGASAVTETVARCTRRACGLEANYFRSMANPNA